MLDLFSTTDAAATCDGAADSAAASGRQPGRQSGRNPASSHKGMRLARGRRWIPESDGSARYRLPCGRVAIIDAADVPLVEALPWFSKKSKRTWYVRTAVRGEHNRWRYLHHFFMPWEAGTEVDHIDGNGLNCRRGNLRYATVAQNRQNARKREGCASPFKGVVWSRQLNKWRVRFRRNYLGTFADPVEAAHVWDAAAKAAYGEFAKLNFPVVAAKARVAGGAVAKEYSHLAPSPAPSTGEAK